VEAVEEDKIHPKLQAAIDALDEVRVRLCTCVYSYTLSLCVCLCVCMYVFVCVRGDNPLISHATTAHTHTLKNTGTRPV
jgi:hypothetical protein